MPLPVPLETSMSVQGPGCVKTRLARVRPELFSRLSSTSSIYQCDWFPQRRNRDGKFYAQVQRLSFHTAWVKTGSGTFEVVMSAFTLKSRHLIMVRAKHSADSLSLTPPWVSSCWRPFRRPAEHARPTSPALSFARQENRGADRRPLHQKLSRSGG